MPMTQANAATAATPNRIIIYSHHRNIVSTAAPPQTSDTYACKQSTMDSAPAPFGARSTPSKLDCAGSIHLWRGHQQPSREMLTADRSRTRAHLHETGVPTVPGFTGCSTDRMHTWYLAATTGSPPARIWPVIMPGMEIKPAMLSMLMVGVMAVDRTRLNTGLHPGQQG
jgi:hypothetical protein